MSATNAGDATARYAVAPDALLPVMPYKEMARAASVHNYGVAVCAIGRTRSLVICLP
jgi:hypothetical protein